MLNLDPAKLLVIAVVAIILLGPDRLPQVAKQVGAAWRSFNEFRHRMETEVRTSMPDLPPSHEIARLARSPSALLNKLSSMADDDDEKRTEGNGAGAADGGAGGAGAADGGAGGAAGGGVGGAGGEGMAGASSNGDGNSLPDGAGADGQVADRPAFGPDGVVTGADLVADGADQGLAAPVPTSPPPAGSPRTATPEVITPGDPTLN